MVNKYKQEFEQYKFKDQTTFELWLAWRNQQAIIQMNRLDQS